MGIEEKAAWREEITERLARKPVLRQASFEFFLWWSLGLGADEAELLVHNLLKTSKDRSRLRLLFYHVSRTVQIRARAVNALAEGKAYVAFSGDNQLATGSISATLARLQALTGTEIKGRTWIGDSAVESIIYTAVAKVERSFAIEYPSQWANHELVLVSRLLANLQNEFSLVRQHLQKISIQGFGTPIDIELNYRETTPKEEGGPGVGSEEFGVDIALVVRVEVEGQYELERATFLQCKKLEGTHTEGEWESSFDIRTKQRDDLIRQTESSFYLFLVPAYVREECWIVPARLVRDLMEISNRKTVLLSLFANRASRSLAHWMTFDLIGLWIGDEREEILMKAKGNHPGRTPRFLVSITIRKGKKAQQG